MATFTILKTLTKLANGEAATMPTIPANHICVETFTRTPATSWQVHIPAHLWPTTTDVSSDYKALVEAVLVKSAKEILYKYVTSSSTDHSAIPDNKFTLAALCATVVNTVMTADRLIQLWTSSQYYVLKVAPKLTDAKGTQLLRIQAAIKSHKDKLTALASKDARSKLDDDALNIILLKLDTADMDTPLGSYLASRIEEVQAEEVDSTDLADLI